VIHHVPVHCVNITSLFSCWLEGRRSDADSVIT
jgi:hypothetical protein